MTIEEKKAYLASYINACKMVEHCDERIVDWQRVKKQIRAMICSTSPGNVTKHDGLLELLKKVEGLIKKIQEQRSGKEQTLENIERIILGVPDEREKELLRLRYINGMKWADISEEMLYSCEMIHRIHRKALSKLAL